MARRRFGTRGSLAVALVVAVLAGCIGGDDDGAEEVDSPDATLSAPETLPPVPVDATIPSDTLAGEDDRPIDDVLADGTVTAEELAAPTSGYIECLAAGGASGRYAYDIELRTGLVVEWIVDDVDPATPRSRRPQRRLLAAATSAT